MIYESCPKSVAQLLVKTKKFIFTKKYIITLQCNPLAQNARSPAFQ